LAFCQKLIFCWISSMNLNILPSGYMLIDSHLKIVISRTLNTHENIYGENLCNWAAVVWKLQVLAFCQHSWYRHIITTNGIFNTNEWHKQLICQK
jgi:hypothetical protein